MRWALKGVKWREQGDVELGDQAHYYSLSINFVLDTLLSILHALVHSIFVTTAWG